MNNKNKKIVTGVAIASLLTGGALATSAFVSKISKALLYRHHRHDDTTTQLEKDYHATSVYVKNNTNLRLRGILIEQSDATKTILICHPFALEARDMEMYVPFLLDTIPNSNILLVDARGHGQSDGYIRGFGIKDIEDIKVWNDYIIEKYGNEHKIIMFGKECGANVILNAASKHILKNVVAIISDGAYMSPYDVLGHRLEKDYKMPRIPTLPLIKRKIMKEAKINIKESTVSLVKHNDIATLYFHARYDDFVPIDHVYPLYNASRGEKSLYVIKEQTYLSQVDKSEENFLTYKSFVDTYCK